MRLLIMGTGEFAEPTFQTLLDSRHQVVGLVTNPDRPAGKEREMTRHIKQIAVARGVPLFQPESVNTSEGVAGVKAFQPELLVVAAYGQILSAEVLEAAPRGGINVHASLLPKYRGAAPINWAIYHGEKQTGVTIIRMSTKLDAGDMLAQETIDILPEETAGELEARLAPLGARLALQVIGQIEAGTVKGAKQDPALVTKAPKLKKEHGLIDWSRTAEQVCCQIRAMQPWPTAYTYWHGDRDERLIIWQGRPLSEPPPQLPEHMLLKLVECSVARVAKHGLAPGTVDDVTAESIVVACGGGLLSIVRLQPAGKRAMTAAQYLHGHRVKIGDKFGGLDGDASVAAK